MSHSEAFLKLVNQSRTRIQETTIEAVKQRMDRGEKLNLIDTREDNEWQGGRILGAVHLGKGIIERDIEARFPDRNAELILYCGGGFRSALAADALQQMGYTRVISMDGGFRAWKAAHYPIES